MYIEYICRHLHTYMHICTRAYMITCIYIYIYQSICMLTSRYIEYHRIICLTLPRPTTFSLNRRLWNFLCNWAFMTCREVSMARLRTLAVHENSADWDVHVDIWLWHGGVKMLLPEDPDPVQTCHAAFIICLGKCDFGWVPRYFICVFAFFVDIIGFMFFVCKGSNSRQTGETNVSIAFDLVIPTYSPGSLQKLVAPFLDIIDNMHRYVWSIYIYNIYIYYTYHIQYILHVCVLFDST